MSIRGIVAYPRDDHNALGRGVGVETVGGSPVLSAHLETYRANCGNVSACNPIRFEQDNGNVLTRAAETYPTESGNVSVFRRMRFKMKICLYATNSVLSLQALWCALIQEKFTGDQFFAEAKIVIGRGQRHTLPVRVPRIADARTAHRSMKNLTDTAALRSI